MTLTLHKKNQSETGYPIEWDSNGQAIAWSDNKPVMLWKFIDENGNLWNTETPIGGTEEDAASIILASVISE